MSYAAPIHGLDSDAEPTSPDAARSLGYSRPRIVCICGSMRFQNNMLEASIDESLAGRIVLLPLVNMKRPDWRWPEERVDEIKADLDRLHFAKIDRADEVLVVNPGGYVGDSTTREIAYAVERGKPVRYLVDQGIDAPSETAPALEVPVDAPSQLARQEPSQDPSDLAPWYCRCSSDEPCTCPDTAATAGTNPAFVEDTGACDEPGCRACGPFPFQTEKDPT
jgi:hypothetical protein